MPRPILEQNRLHSAIAETVAGWKAGVVREVQTAVAAHPVVVVGMAQNPYVGRVRKALDAAGVAHHDIDFGSYFSCWRERTAIKMWCGWPTYPIVFVRGTLVGGAQDTQRLIASGELQRLLAA